MYPVKHFVKNRIDMTCFNPFISIENTKRNSVLLKSKLLNIYILRCSEKDENLDFRKRVVDVAKRYEAAAILIHK